MQESMIRSLTDTHSDCYNGYCQVVVVSDHITTMVITRHRTSMITILPVSRVPIDLIGTTLLS